MKKVLIAGATGYSGGFVAKAFKDAGYYTKVLVRNPGKFKAEGIPADEMIQAEITQPDTLLHICNNVDIVFTSVGITRQKDGLTYHDVDYQGNLNLLNEAVKSGVGQFIYVSVFNGRKFRDLKICREKERFVDKLRSSGLDYRVIRPTGYFSDMGEYMKMAKKGKVYLFGNGNNHINPVSGRDLAQFCIDAINNEEKEPAVGGPETFAHNDIAQLAFDVLERPAKISHIPAVLVKCIIKVMRLITGSKIYGPFEFVATILSNDMTAPAFGQDKLRDYFKTIKD